jgi:hypothetical protein
MIGGGKRKLHAFILIEIPGAMFFDFIAQPHIPWQPHEVAINRDRTERLAWRIFGKAEL